MSSSLSAHQFHGFSKELRKLATPRYEREIAAGNITRQSVDPSALPGELPSIFNIPQRKLTRANLAAQAPRSAEELAASRRMSSHLYDAQSKAEGVHQAFGPMGPSTTGNGTVYAPRESGRFMERASEGPRGLMRAAGSILVNQPVVKEGPLGRYAAPISEAILGKAGPADPTLTHATMRHELGERAGMKGGGPINPFSSHIGVQPILEEQMATRHDPAATAVMQKLRTGNPEDALVQRAIRQAGGTPDSPLPLGGRGQRSVERILGHNVKDLTPKGRADSIKSHFLQGLLNNGVAPPIGYLPKGVEQPMESFRRLSPGFEEAAGHVQAGFTHPAVSAAARAITRPSPLQGLSNVMPGLSEAAGKVMQGVRHPAVSDALGRVSRLKQFVTKGT